MEASTTNALPYGNGQTRELIEVALHDLALDPVINRSVDERWVAKLAEGFNPAALGLFTVWRTANGAFKIIDGQHRYRAAQIVGFDERVACYVHTGLDEAGAAELFLEVNSQRNVSAIDKFRKAVQAGHPDEVAVADILADRNLVVGQNIGDVGSPTALLAVYHEGGPVLLRRVMDALIGGFPTTPAAQALHGELLSAVLSALKKYGKVKPAKGAPKDAPREYRFDLEHLREKLVDGPTMAELFADRDVKHRQGPQYTKRWHLAGQLVEVYNRGESKSVRLESWSYRAA